VIDQWFKKDLQNIYDTHPVAVFIDESGDAEFLLKTVEKDFTIHRTDSEVEELQVKCLIERDRSNNEKFLIYTRSKKDDLKFIREYCETNGCLEIRYLQNYIKEKVRQTLNLNINLSKEDLISAGKVSIGNTETYWINLSHKGAAGIFDLNKELLPFVHDPDTYSKMKYDDQLRETFYHEVNDLLGQYDLAKPAKALAEEVVKNMLDGLVQGECDKTLETIYKSWLDSISFRNSFNAYLDDYAIPKDIDIWQVNIHHPFRQIDEKWLIEVEKRINDKEALPGLLDRVKERGRSKQARALDIVFWSDVIVLLAFDPKDIAYLGSFSECVEFHKKHFCKLDTAIRNLYTEFLNKKHLLEPLQERYKDHLSVFLDKWFHHWQGLKETQTGTLQKIFDDSNVKTAVIVGDGFTFDIAEQIADKVKGTATLTRDAIIADIPSETENNMSHIYMANGAVEAIQGNREKYLAAQNSDITIDFIRLDEANEEAKPGKFLICTYKDIDDMGEKLGQKALKYFDETVDFFAEKISLLLNSGYEKVYLISDHGFVLTGILSEADKISVTPSGEYYKAERYIRTKDRQMDLTPSLIEVEREYKAFKYLYFARNINPFKTPGPYGFSHGGISPQELVTPFFCWKKAESAVASLPVLIENKLALEDVTGELYQIKIRSGELKGELFATKRKVYLVFFAQEKLINKSEVFTIQPNETITKEYTFDGYQEIEVQLLDAGTKKQLDRTVIRQNKDRDLGGLL